MDAELAAAGAQDLLTTWGPLGIFAGILAVFARTAFNKTDERAEAAWKREVERADRLEAEVNRLNGFLQEKAIPAMLASANALTEYAEILRDQERDRRRGHNSGGEGP